MPAGLCGRLSSGNRRNPYSTALVDLAGVEPAFTLCVHYPRDRISVARFRPFQTIKPKSGGESGKPLARAKTSFSPPVKVSDANILSQFALLCKRKFQRGCLQANIGKAGRTPTHEETLCKVIMSRRGRIMSSESWAAVM